MKKKKFLSVFALIIAIGVGVGTCVHAYERATWGSYEWKTTSWFGINADYWKETYYKHWKYPNTEWIFTLDYLCYPVNWDGTSSNVTVSATRGKSVGKTKSRTLAENLGMNVTDDGVGFNTSMTYSISEGITIGENEAMNYTALLNSSNPYGYYVWELRNEGYKAESSVEWRPHIWSDWEWHSNGEDILFTSRRPYVRLIYTKENPW